MLREPEEQVRNVGSLDLEHRGSAGLPDDFDEVERLVRVLGPGQGPTDHIVDVQENLNHIGGLGQIVHLGLGCRRGRRDGIIDDVVLTEVTDGLCDRCGKRRGKEGRNGEFVCWWCATKATLGTGGRRIGAWLHFLESSELPWR